MTLMFLLPQFAHGCPYLNPVTLYSFSSHTTLTWKNASPKSQNSTFMTPGSSVIFYILRLLASSFPMRFLARYLKTLLLLKQPSAPSMPQKHPSSISIVMIASKKSISLITRLHVLKPQKLNHRAPIMLNMQPSWHQCAMIIYWQARSVRGCTCWGHLPYRQLHGFKRPWLAYATMIGLYDSL